MDGLGYYGKECWLINELGRESVQALQDALADMLDLSLCLWDRKGKRLTVWSRSSLFCYDIISKNKERCKKHKLNVIQQVCERKETVISTCYMGINFFCVPVLHGDEVEAILYGGGFLLSDGNPQLSYVSRLGYEIPVLGEDRMHNIINFLENFLNIMNKQEKKLKSDEIKPRVNSPDIFLLQNHLSLREMEIVKLVLAGMSNKEIAQNLGISEKTVKVHMSSILRKLSLKDRRQLIIFCQQHLGKR